MPFKQMDHKCTQPRDIVMCIKCLLRARFPSWNNELTLEDSLTVHKWYDLGL